MAKLTKERIAQLKSKGFLRNRGTECFSGRIVPAGCVFSAEDLRVVAEIAERFGSGKVAFTTRLTAEVVGIHHEKVEEAIAFAESHNLYFGGTGAKIRPVTACKGTTCIYGNCDTQGLAKELHQRYYLGRREEKLPHKFKIAVGGCPNSCMKPSLNDFGIEAHCEPDYDPDKCRGCKVCAVERACPVQAAKLEGEKLQIHENCISCGVCTGKCPFHAVAHEAPVRYQIFIGGTWGKTTRIGTPLSRMVTYEEIFPLLDKVLDWYKENDQGKERLGAMIDRLGVEKLEQDLGW